MGLLVASIHTGKKHVTGHNIVVLLGSKKNTFFMASAFLFIRKYANIQATVHNAILVRILRTSLVQLFEYFTPTLRPTI